MEDRRSFYFYCDILFCLEEIKGLMIRHSQSNWFLEIIYTNGTIMNYQCIHKDEAQSLFTALRQMLKAKEIQLKDKF